MLLAETTVRASFSPYFQQLGPWRVGTVQLDAGPVALAHLHRDAREQGRVAGRTCGGAHLPADRARLGGATRAVCDGRGVQTSVGRRRREQRRTSRFLDADVHRVRAIERALLL